MSTINPVWKHLGPALRKASPAVSESLNNPVTEAQLDELRNTLGVVLPDSYLNFLRGHNGQNYDPQYMLYGQEFLAHYRVLQEWKVWHNLTSTGAFEGKTSDPRPGIKNDWYNVRWIPISYNGSGDHYCIDLDPAPGGTMGQIITMWHDAPERKILANSFQGWIEKYTADLISGDLVYSESYGGIIPLADLTE